MDAFSLDDLFTIGIGLDLVGAYVLGKGLLAPPAIIIRGAGSYYGPGSARAGRRGARADREDQRGRRWPRPDPRSGGVRPGDHEGADQRLLVDASASSARLTARRGSWSACLAQRCKRFQVTAIDAVERFCYKASSMPETFPVISGDLSRR